MIKLKYIESVAQYIYFFIKIILILFDIFYPL